MARADLMDYDKALELFEPVIGLEVHVELNTKTKMFSSAANPANSANHDAEPNTLVAPVDMGLPGSMPTVNAEAIRSFREAARLDPDCAMCWWGVAVALGPNINLPMPPDAVAPAWEALQRAQALAPKASPVERAFKSLEVWGPEAQRKVMGGNAARIYNLPI